MIAVKEVPIKEVIKVNTTIPEFDNYQEDHFKRKCSNKERLFIVGYIDNKPVGYLVGYNKFDDQSFYCWMAGVAPQFRKKGILKALMDYEDKWAREKGYNKIRIKTRNNRREMLSYLIKHEFMFTKVHAKENVKDNRIMLEREL